MTENKALEIGKALYENITLKGNNVIPVAKYIEFVGIAIQALEEIQQIKEIISSFPLDCGNTVEDIREIYRQLRGFLRIGTIEEFKALKEKNVPKKPICKSMPYSEEVGMNDEWLCPTCKAYVGYFTEGMNEPEQMEYCNECGQHIARDWSK